MAHTHLTTYNPDNTLTADSLTRPEPLTREQWPPDYAGVYRWREAALTRLVADPHALAGARSYYSTRPVEFINDWMDTYDPRRQDSKWIPFVFFKRQGEFIQMLQSLDACQEGAVVEKSRDMGATWASAAYSLWCWLFLPNDATGWGSRKESLVDKLGDPDSIFEKIRLLLRRLPAIWHPAGFNWSRNATYMKMLNPENGSIIGGEAGDNIGRGGRRSRYFVDEAAFLERPEKIESALGDNTRVRIDISTHNGLGTIFKRKIDSAVIWRPDADLPAGHTRLFIFDWKDHPDKTQEWYDTRKARYEREGLAHIFAQEVDRNPAASVSNVIIPYEWVQAAVDAHIKMGWQPSGAGWMAGLDVADMGEDRNALTLREGVIWRHCEEWGERDPGVTARRALIACRPYAGRIMCMYDSIGVGAGVKTEYNRLTVDEGIISASELPFVPWNAGAGVLHPFERIVPDDDKSLHNQDFFDNLKAQAWWSLRTRFYKTYRAIIDGEVYSTDELISLDSSMPMLEKLMKELGQPTYGQSKRLKMLIEKTPSGTKSPNLADSGVMAFFPLPHDSGTAQVGGYGY